MEAVRDRAWIQAAAGGKIPGVVQVPGMLRAAAPVLYRWCRSNKAAMTLESFLFFPESSLLVVCNRL